MLKKKSKTQSKAQRLLNRDLLHSGAYRIRIERNRKHRNRQDFDGLFFIFGSLYV